MEEAAAHVKHGDPVLPLEAASLGVLSGRMVGGNDVALGINGVNTEMAEFVARQFKDFS